MMRWLMWGLVTSGNRLQLRRTSPGRRLLGSKLHLRPRTTSHRPPLVEVDSSFRTRPNEICSGSASTAKSSLLQLCLCDNDQGRRRFHYLENARWFDDEKVEYAKPLADPDVAASEQLVVKWGDTRFITRQDNSSLMAALLQWRHNMSPDRLMASLHREVIMRKPEVLKMACLMDIQRIFSLQHKEPFYAGFGNRITDALSYRSVNVPSARIFAIDSSGEVKMELLELAGYKSSYIHMTDLVDQMFPPVPKKWATEFTDFNYWRDPWPEVDFPELDPPLSPALSAVSDTSVTSRPNRLRNFSLRSSSSTPTAAAAANSIARNGRKEVSPSPLVRSVVSDDRGTTLADSASESEEHH